MQCHALRMPAKTPLAGDKIDAPAACAVPFRPYCEGVVTRTRNVSEYMLVLALCLVYYLFVYRRERLKRLTGSYYSDFVLRHTHVLIVLLPNLWSPYVIGQTIYIFMLFLLLLFFPRLISAVGDWMFTILWHMVWP